HDAEEQKAYYYRAATIFEETLERPEDAIAVLAKVLEIDPEEFRAIDKQIELYLGLEQWEPLLRAYNHKADVVQDFEEKRRLYTEVGAVYERELKDIPRAIDTYQRILELAPDDMTAIGRLDALYQATENWQELLSVLERQADLAEDPFEVIGYRYRIAELWHRRLNDPARAVEIYGEILDVNAEHGPTLAALESMIDENVEALAAALVLEPVYRATGEAERLIRVIEVQIAAEEDPIAKVDRLHQVADLYENHLDRPAQAFEAYGRAVACDPGNEDTLSHLERLAHDVEEGWRKVATLYDEQIQARREDAPDDVLDLALRTAQIYEIHLEEPEPAIERLKLVLEIDPAHVDAIRSLDRLYDATE
ncbi:MAG TPA: tetratricopeptide repeat protein, partial [Planctomycetota bacterium]|nr:tetratricopeptide repeat protein [Planctomycetota bacterium]